MEVAGPKLKQTAKKAKKTCGQEKDRNEII